VNNIFYIRRKSWTRLQGSTRVKTQAFKLSSLLINRYIHVYI